MNNIEELEQAISATDQLRAEIAKLNAKEAELEAQRTAAHNQLLAAEAELESAAGLALLDGGADQIPALEERVQQLSRELRAAKSALKTQAGRITNVANLLRLAELAEHQNIRPLASELATLQLQLVWTLTQQLCVALTRWYDLESTARGARITGKTQCDAHGLAGIFERFAVRMHSNEMTVGHPNGVGALLSARQILAAAKQAMATATTPKKGTKAA